MGVDKFFQKESGKYDEVAVNEIRDSKRKDFKYKLFRGYTKSIRKSTGAQFN
jgi:hypothetical protein